MLENVPRPAGQRTILSSQNGHGPGTPDDPASSFDDVFSRLIPPGFPWTALFCGEGMGALSSYLAGWMAWKEIDVILLDGANRFDPYRVSSFARRVLVSPETLLRRIQVARAFTCYQMATLIAEKLTPLFHREKHVLSQFSSSFSRRGVEEKRRAWVVLLGPITTFLDEDVPEQEARPLFERSLRKLRSLAEEGVPFLVLQASAPSLSKRSDLMRKLTDFSNRVWRVSPGEEGMRFILEKGPVDAEWGARRVEMNLLSVSGARGQGSRTRQTKYEE